MPSLVCVRFPHGLGDTAMATPPNIPPRPERNSEPELDQPPLTKLDPHLQHIVWQYLHSKTIDPLICDECPNGKIKIDVLAKLKDPSKSTDGLEVACRIGSIVTASVAVERIEEVRTNENVISLKAARRLRPNLPKSVPDIRATPADLRLACPDLLLDGSDVVIGIVDFGADFRHRNFQDDDKKTRLLALWDQGKPQSDLSPPPPFNYGREFKAARINQALQAANPYQDLDYDPGKHAHGTQVMDVAAGNGMAKGGTPEFPVSSGVAPRAHLVFVELEVGDPPQALGNSRTLVEAVQYIFEKADEMKLPCVVNLSIEAYGGPHDGTTPVEEAFDTLLQTPNRAICIAAGNSFAKRDHAKGEVKKEKASELSWVINPGDRDGNELEVWYSGTAVLSVELDLPTGEVCGPVPLNSTRDVTLHTGEIVGRIYHRFDDPNNHDNHIDIILEKNAPPLTWKVRLINPDDSPVSFHAWIEKDDEVDGNQSKFGPDGVSVENTLGTIACGRLPLTVGSYKSSGLDPHNSIALTSSSGTTRDGRSKPEVSAPGENIFAAESHTQRTALGSGTSLSAPHVTGLIALIMQAARGRGRSLTINEIREAVIAVARTHPPQLSDANTGDKRYGFGRVDAAASCARFAKPRFFPVPSGGNIIASSEQVT